MWKHRSIPHGVMADIYDGNIWKSFLKVNGENFLLKCYNLGLLLNVDWFQPYAHVQYSVGAIYIAILNLPHRLRYKRENMLLVGVIPGPHEPRLHINYFLEPVVDDLLKLWEGVQMDTAEGNQRVQAVLLCNSSDIPAMRKVGGFVGHAALKGCSRCLRNFETARFSEKPNYGGFNPSQWPKRTPEQHKQKGLEWKLAKTQTERQRIERESGIRYTELLRLPYFDSAHFGVIDPMHNMLLGTTKRMITIWKEKGLLNSPDYVTIQNKVDSFITPPDVGRIPHKISSGFSSFTADQFKNWTLIYSLIVLKGILPEAHYNCWYIFVQACSLLCSRAISHTNIMELNSLLLSFCKNFEQLYGTDLCTPNLHLHCHLKECFDYGLAAAFWLFACERMNGILGSISTNHHAIEAQLMRKFTTSQQALNSINKYDTNEIEMLLTSSQVFKGSNRYDELPELPFLTDLDVPNIGLFSESCCLV